VKPTFLNWLLQPENKSIDVMLNFNVQYIGNRYKIYFRGINTQAEVFEYEGLTDYFQGVTDGTKELVSRGLMK
jgi:hypothetical protein